MFDKAKAVGVEEAVATYSISAIDIAIAGWEGGCVALFASGKVFEAIAAWGNVQLVLQDAVGKLTSSLRLGLKHHFRTA